MHRSKKTLLGKSKPRKSEFLEGDSATGNHVMPWSSPSYRWIYGRSRTRGWNGYCDWLQVFL